MTVAMLRPESVAVGAPEPPRLAGWLDGPLSELTCPSGHHIQDGQLSVLAHVFRCRHRAPPNGGECGRLVFAHIFPAAAGESLVYLVEVTWRDVEQLRRLHSTREILRYLGVPLWPRRAPRRR